MTNNSFDGFMITTRNTKLQNDNDNYSSNSMLCDNPFKEKHTFSYSYIAIHTQNTHGLFEQIPHQYVRFYVHSVLQDSIAIATQFITPYPLLPKWNSNGFCTMYMITLIYTYFSCPDCSSCILVIATAIVADFRLLIRNTDHLHFLISSNLNSHIRIDV